MTKTIIDPNKKSSSKEGIYGLPFKESESEVIYIPVPWDVTTSYRPGTAKGPEAILKASEQIDFFDLDFKDSYKAGLFMKRPNPQIKKLNTEGRALAKKIIEADEETLKKNKVLGKNLIKVNELCEKLNELVYKEAKAILDKNKMAIVVGGDHSSPFGAIKAYSEKYPNLGILHFDAHSDTRISYMGFTNSHASIMYNVMEKLPNIGKLVQVGIRDLCDQEFTYINENSKIEVYFDQNIARRKMQGENFLSIAREIISHLPEHVYISFDIDGLDPRFCPNTGTPVPGGLDYQEVILIINELIKADKKLVGLDLVEVAPNPKDKTNEWDANVAMRLLYKMTSAALASKEL